MLEMKKINHFVLFLIWIPGILILGCKDFLEPALTNRTLVMIAPADQLETRTYQINFWWEQMENALSYRLQIVKPDFNNAAALILDTLIKGKTRFDKSLDPGTYQWRVRAENGSSVSGYTTHSFIVHESTIQEQKVMLKLPPDQFISNSSELKLSWEKLFGVSDYRLQVDTLDFSDEAKLVLNQLYSSNEYIFVPPKDGQFKWRVRAELGLEQSRWSEVYSIILDRTAPAKAVLLSPVNNAFVAKPVRLQWQRIPTAKKYMLYLYKSDQVSLFSPSFPMLISATTYLFTEADPNEKIYWKVQAIDQAGNEGEFSDLFNFTIQ